MLRLATTKNVKLNASHSGSFFQDLYNQYQEYDGLDIAFDNYPDAVLDMKVTQDSLEIKLHSKSKVLLHFEVYYIEDDEYGDALYDVYTQDEEEEGLPEITAASMLDDWFANLRKRIGIKDEDEERAFLETRSSSDPAFAKIDYIRSEIFRTVNPSFVDAELRKQIEPGMLKKLLPVISSGIYNKLKASTHSELCKFIDCDYKETKKQIRLIFEYEIFDQPYRRTIDVFNHLQSRFYDSCYIYYREDLQGLDYVLQLTEKDIIEKLYISIAKFIKKSWPSFAETVFNPSANVIPQKYLNNYIEVNISTFASMPIDMEELSIPKELESTGFLNYKVILNPTQSQELLRLPYKGTTLQKFITPDPNLLNSVALKIKTDYPYSELLIEFKLVV